MPSKKGILKSKIFWLSVLVLITAICLELNLLPIKPDGPIFIALKWLITIFITF
jgi:hypothetical protein